MRVNPARDFDADHFAPEVRAGIDQRPRNLAVIENALLAIDVLQEKIQRHHALRQAAFDAVPFRVREDARDQIEGKQPFGALAVAVNGESDALNQERKVGELAAFFELRRRHRAELLEKLGILRARLAGRDEHLIVKVPRIVSFKQTATHAWRWRWRPSRVL